MNKKIAILHFAYPPNIGGVEGMVQEHAEVLNDLGYEITIITGSGEETNPKIKIVIIPELQSVVSFNPFLQEKILDKGIIDEDFYNLATQIEQKLDHALEKIEVVVVHNMITIVRNLPFIYAFKNYTKKYPNKKYISWTHDHSYINQFKIKDLDKIINSKLERELLTISIKNVLYIAISESFKEPLKQLMNLDENQIKIIPNGLNLKEFLEIDDLIWGIVEKFKFIKRFPIILSPVNILERKNLIYSLEIISFLKRKYPNITYIITGKPSKHRSTLEYFNSLKEKVKSLKLENNIIFLADFINRAMVRSEIHDLYQLADAIFFFSKSENFGLPLIEAATTKTPIFVSNLKVFREIGKDLIQYIDYKMVSSEEASQTIIEYIENNKVIQFNFLTRSQYDLKTILQEKLIPILK